MLYTGKKAEVVIECFKVTSAQKWPSCPTVTLQLLVTKLLALAASRIQADTYVELQQVGQ